MGFQNESVIRFVGTRGPKFLCKLISRLKYFLKQQPSTRGVSVMWISTLSVLLAQ